MIYKVGDKVIIKTWEEMEKEYGTNTPWTIAVRHGFNKDMEDTLSKISPHRVLTIRKVENERYKMEEISYAWCDDMIEDYEELDPINSRFEIMDL